PLGVPLSPCPLLVTPQCPLSLSPCPLSPPGDLGVSLGSPLGDTGVSLSLSLSPGRAQEVQAENVTVLEGGTAEITCHLSLSPVPVPWVSPGCPGCPLGVPRVTLGCPLSPGRAQEVQAENVTVLEGGTAEITCHLHRYDGSIVVIQNPARQTLFFNGTRALKDERFELAEFSRRRLRLRLARARLEDEGGYFCQLYADDTHHQIATLTVLVPPEPPLVEARALAVEGAELELTCLVPRARPLATLRWYRDRRELPGAVTQGQVGKVFWQRSELRLPVERRDHGAIVTCEATHPALARGQRRQTQYQLDVQCEALGCTGSYWFILGGTGSGLQTTMEHWDGVTVVYAGTGRDWERLA
uniref:Cell adhesion molecule 4 n=1 Tax=Cyanoderma ruficeps TaxID=181631 RepID=A0A8C3QIZ7_9PASS